MMRRRIAAGVGVLLVIVIVLIVNGIIKGQKVSALQEYNRNVNAIAKESETQVSDKLFAALVDAGAKPPLDVEVQIDQLHSQAARIATRARQLGAPGEMAEAQRNLLLALDMRSEAVAKIANLVRAALGGKSTEATTHIAGDMEMLLASDVLWSQRVKPLIVESLAAGGAGAQTTAVSRSLPNLGWLDPETVSERMAGEESSTSGALAPGTHGHALTGVSVGTTTLQPEPAVNHVAGGANPTFTVALQNTGENAETNVKVDVAVTSGGKVIKTSHTINRTQAGEALTVDIPVSGVTAGTPSKVEVKVDAVAGETNTENNKATYLAIFE